MDGTVVEIHDDQPATRRMSQRLAKQPSIEEVVQHVPLDANRNLENIDDYQDTSKIIRNCTQRNGKTELLTDDDRLEVTNIARHNKYNNNSVKSRANAVSHRSKTIPNHVSKNNNNHLKEEDLEKRFEEKKFENLQRKLSDSIRSRDEAAAAVTILPSDLRPSVETNGSLDLLDQQQRLHTTADYRLSDSQCISNGTVIAQSGLGCEFQDSLHDSKAKVKLKSDIDDDDDMVLSNGLEPMDTYMPLVGDIPQPLLDDDPPKKVFLTDSSDSMDAVLCNGQDLDDKRRKRDDKKDDKNKKKKLKPLEEENLSK